MRNFEKDRAKDTGNGKIERVLGIYTCLINGQAVNENPNPPAMLGRIE